jgi:hypothetical protein
MKFAPFDNPNIDTDLFLVIDYEFGTKNMHVCFSLKSP